MQSMILCKQSEKLCMLFAVRNQKTANFFICLEKQLPFLLHIIFLFHYCIQASVASLPNLRGILGFQGKVLW